MQRVIIFPISAALWDVINPEDLSNDVQELRKLGRVEFTFDQYRSKLDMN